MTSVEITQIATVAISAITAIAALISAIGTFINRRAIREVAASTDGMKDELIKEVRKTATAQGREDEKADPHGPPIVQPEVKK